MAASYLVDISEELRAASARAEALCARVGLDRLRERPAPDKWSVAECIAHLRITSASYFPIWQDALHAARQGGLRGAEPYRVDLAGRLLAWSLEPPPKFKLRTPAPFQPVDTGPAEAPATRQLPDYVGTAATIDRSSRCITLIAYPKVAPAAPTGEKAR